jgi:hypothetical protein
MTSLFVYYGHIANLLKGAVLRGWIDLTSGRDSALKKSVKFFDEAIQG